ncbi:hypothetical protein MD484_g4828, partial [Candolleomyces efflorescens]
MSFNTPAFSFPTAPVSLLPGAGPMLAVHDCAACDHAHPNPIFLSHTDIPPEIVEGILGQVANPLDMNRLSRLCPKFKALATYVMYGRLSKVLDTFGISDSREFLRLVRRNDGYWAGPSLLPALFPDVTLQQGPFSNRLDLHLPDRNLVISVFISHLRSLGYSLTSTLSERAVEPFASGTLGYPSFGRTVKRIVRFHKVVAGTDKEVVLFVSRSALTGFLSIVEYPTTLLMVYVDGINLHVLYPYLTGNRRGLVNLPFPQPSSPPRFPPVIQWLLPHFDLKERLTEWAEYRFHLCEQNSYCPLRLRHELDNRGLLLGCTIDHPGLRPYRRRENHIFPPFWNRQHRTISIWRLRCCASCLANMPFPDQEINYTGLYVANDMTAADRSFDDEDN